MAYSHVTYTGDGTNTLFTVTFPFLKRDFVTISINGVQVKKEDIEWITDSSIRLKHPPEAGSSVMLFRNTAKDKAVTDFMDGAMLDGESLNEQTTQLLHLSLIHI